MTQNIYDHPEFFEGYAQLDRSVKGLKGAPEWPAIERILPDFKGLDIVDLGCGYGWFCREARAKGAKQLLGLNLSTKMLDKARQMTQDAQITYQIANLEKLFFLENQYDLVYSSLALHYVENLSGLLKTVYQALKPKGYFVFSAEHPIYTARKQQGWLIDKEGQKFWPVNQYQVEGKRVTNWLGAEVIKQHRTLGTYVNMLIQSGFTIKHLEEWGPSEQQVIQNSALSEEIHRPMMFFLSAQKNT
ncbi:class I SAM-dependent methyltransferase [Candidatus Williamhamiltonella defendens]|uniref:SAM-dependent methyltransferase n=1 Tax=Candidatus Hamiltonella defensa (Bemisia tabaci) TaxID=672795 RepID=A0A249DYV9_9ENTR|nr:class I SAM-dependent methyltransferase [Candidatus Hamiltonella defensa]ASX26718.1 SAM-dependent methyltransferase [Candidatus Hamiltonella defensa (Bemisia tabaci)]CED78673.1 Methyltransferase type 11 [Candidatus Hamiltonella defensa (Bemisia tabaci)]